MKMARPKKAQFNAEETNQDSQKRVFGNSFEFKSDLFKLEVAECNLNKSWNDVPMLESVDHVHFFHTYDSNGRKMARTNIVAGHFHVIEYEEQGGDKPVKIISVSGPMHEVKRRIMGRWQKVAEAISETLQDEHTHKITYRRSEQVKARQTSVQAANMEAQEANRTAAISGIQIG
jgi:hypothetical protein